MAERKNSPVFVIGCHRSGTALLYTSLFSARAFFPFLALLPAYTSLLPMCGDPSVPKNREKMLQVWLRSKPFRRTGLGAEDLRSKILQACRSGGDFLRITLGEVARRQGAQRWAAYD